MGDDDNAAAAQPAPGARDVTSLPAGELAAVIAHLTRGDWQAAHLIVQLDESAPLACWAHGIVHLMEGDRDNARYWYRRAGRGFPALADLSAELRELAAAAGVEPPG